MPQNPLDDRRDQVAQRLNTLAERYSQSEIARKTGASRNNINRYLHGTRMPTEVASALVDGLGVNPVWLLTGEGATYLTDVTGDISRSAGDLLELVKAMNAVAQMRMGSLAGKHHLTVLRELNDALGDFERLREGLDERTAPIMKEMLTRYRAALEKRELDLADDLRSALLQVSRICHDEALHEEFLREQAWHETYFGDREVAVQLQREIFRRVFTRSHRLTDELCVEARDIVTFVGASGRIREALRIGHSVLAMADGDEDSDDFHVLNNTVAHGELAAGRMDLAMPRLMSHAPRLSPKRRGSAATTTSAILLTSGNANFDEVCAFQPEYDQYRGRTMVQMAIWLEQPEVLERACSHFIGLGPAIDEHLFIARYARCLNDLMAGRQGAWRDLYERDLPEFRKLRKGEHESMQPLNYMVQLPRLAGDEKLALENLKTAVRKLAAMPYEFTPAVMQLAEHHRNVLKLVPEDGKDRLLAPARRQARQFFRDMFENGFGLFRELASA